MALSLLRQEAATVAGVVTLLFFVLAGESLAPEALGLGTSTVPLTLLFLVMMWCAFSVVRHAESLATLLGEPYGTLILTLAVIGIEVAVIAAVMISGTDKPALARDTMFSVLMIVLNGLVGLCLVVGGLRHRSQVYNLQGANAYLAVLLPLGVLCLILPSFTPSAPGGELSQLQSGFLVFVSIALYGTFLAIQTVTHSDIFQQPVPDGEGQVGHDHHFEVRTVPFHSIGLVAALLPIVLLSKSLATYITFTITVSGAPLALGGFLVAALILTPEALSAVNSARENSLQRAVNICLGSALATIGLTVPAVLAVGWLTGERVELGLGMADIVLLSLTLVVSVVTFVSQRTNALQGVVHLSLFATYVVLIFDSAA